MTDLENLTFPSIPIEYLHDKDILEVYVKRLLTLGETLGLYPKHWKNHEYWIRVLQGGEFKSIVVENWRFFANGSGYC